MTEITKKNYDRVLTAPRAVVKVEADFCGSCRMLTPIMEKVEEEYPDVPFYNVDREKFPPFIGKYPTDSVPALIFLRNGEEVHRIVGIATTARINHAVSVL